MSHLCTESNTLAYEIHVSRGIAAIPPPVSSMFLQYTPRKSATPNDQPHIVRKATDLKCHPTQIQRAMLGDTKGAVFLPFTGEPGNETSGEQTSRCFMRPALRRTISEDCPFPARHGLLSDPSGPQAPSMNHLSIIKERVYPTRPSTITQTLSDTKSYMSLDNNPRELPRQTSQRSCSISSMDGKQDDTSSFDDTARETLSSSGLEAQTEPLPDGPSSLRTDGAGDQQSLRRPSSFNCNRRASGAVRLVHFASHLNLGPAPEETDHTSASGTPPSQEDAPAKLFRNPFLEPTATESRKVSDSSSDTSHYLRANAFAGHRDTLARIPRPQESPETDLEPIIAAESATLPSISSCSTVIRSFPGFWNSYHHTRPRRRSSSRVPISVAFVEQLLTFVSFQDYLNMRLICRQWYRALPYPLMPGSYRVPREVLQLIFSFLAPCDFDAARHTCRKWFDAGQDLFLLRLMLRTAQCQNAFKSDLLQRSGISRNTNNDASKPKSCDSQSEASPAAPAVEGLVSEEWLMSKRIATATRLSIDWRGPWSRRSISEGVSRFHVVEQINFRRILIGLSSWDNAGHEKTFTVSTCGKYLLAVSGHDIFVYDLRDSEGNLSAIVRLAANNNVLRASMNTSSGRYAVAALLSNRTGVLWDLNDNYLPAQSRFHSGEPMTLGMRTEVHGPRVQDRTETLTGHLPLRRREITSSLRLESHQLAIRHTGGLDHPAPHSLDLDAPRDTLGPFLDDSQSICATPESEDEQTGPSTGIAIRTRPSAVIQNLGMPDDAPRSVAICPSRKCVAFGCRLGIELHWVDALTGGDLNRWFPLAAPSDHLYFLPQREGVDSGKKLRLISSAAGPSAPSTSRSESLPARFAVRAKFHDRGRRQSMTRLFFGNLPFPSAAVFPNGWSSDNVPSDEDRQGILRTVDCDHYQAVPISDGYHMLYTDPTNGLLCLGSDAPLGGPTKLVRKAVFVPPTVGDNGWAGLMSCYSAGQDLQWGVRIVAAYRDGRLVLYNVPADIFSHLRQLRSAPDVWDEGAGVIAQSDLLMDDVLTAHANTSTDPGMGNAASRLESPGTPLRTVQFEGVEIGHVGRDIVDDVAVDTTNGGVRVWVFCRSGLARLLDIYVDIDHQVRQRLVGSDGLLHDAATLSGSQDEGRRSLKGKERAHSEDEDPTVLRRMMGCDGTSEEQDEPTEVPKEESDESSCHEARSTGGFQRLGDHPERLHVEILASAASIMEDPEGPFEIEILTDWRDECLFMPYIIILG